MKEQFMMAIKYLEQVILLWNLGSQKKILISSLFINKVNQLRISNGSISSY